MKPARLQLYLAATGCVLLVLAALAVLTRAASGSGGGTILRVAMSSDVDYVDPGLDYLSAGWEIQYATVRSHATSARLWAIASGTSKTTM